MTKSKSEEKQKRVKESLASLAKELDESKLTKKGQIIFHLTGSGGDEFCLDCGSGETKVSEGVAGRMQSSPLIEVMGDASVIKAILEHKKDPVKQFVGGGLRVRGDLRYLSDIALELGIIDTPL